MTYTRAMPALRRTLVIAAGETAATVAGRATALSQAWLGQEPPLAVVALAPTALLAAADAATRQVLAEACDRLAAADLARQLREAGRPPARGDQIAAWLIVEAAGPSEVADGPDETARALPAILSEVAWQRLRAHVSVHALLLGDPAAAGPPAAWAARLTAAGVTAIGLAGPVNADRLRWDAADWQEQAAVALALWLWSDIAPASDHDGAAAVGAPGHVGADGCPPSRPRGMTVWALGATAWPTPGAEIRRLLIPRCAFLAAGRLLGEPPSAPTPTSPPSLAGKGAGGLGDWEPPELVVAPERHRLSLEAAVPAEPARLTWNGRRPAWEALATLPEALRAEADAHSRQAHDGQFGPRTGWLEEQVARWSAALDQMVQDRLTRPNGWPELRCMQSELGAKTAALRAACAEIQDWLEEAGDRFACATAEVTQAEGTLAALCRSFPAPDWTGAIGLLLAPWRWPGLAWAYLMRLPQAGQRYLDARARQGAARWTEANLHTLRQAYLAMAQMVQERKRQVAAWIEAIEAAGRSLAGEVAELPPPPAPWDDRLLEALAGELAAGPGPGLSWLGVEAAGEDDVRRGLIAWAAGRAATLDGLTAADWLALALDDEGLARWLGDRLAGAAPLWPVIPPVDEAAVWLLCPGQTGPARPAEALAVEERLTAALQGQLAHGVMADGDLRRGACGADVIAVLRMIGLQLTTEEGL